MHQIVWDWNNLLRNTFFYKLFVQDVLEELKLLMPKDFLHDALAYA